MDGKLNLRRAPRAPKAEAGFSLIELMIAMVVLVVGMMGIMVMVTTAIATNNRAKMDSTATALAQMVAETVAAQSIATVQDCAAPTPIACVRVRDCNPAALGGPTVWTIQTAGAPATNPDGSAGALLDANGNIDFTQSYAAVAGGNWPAPSYKMQFVSCGSGGRQATYDVRWNVRNISAFSRQVTVSARLRRQTAAGGAPGEQLKYFALPVTLRTISGF
jgi:prepilin-type N-terminal cleavage/methylation domain-containing protein